MSFSESEKEYSSESEKSLENYASAESEDEIDKTVDGSFIDHGAKETQRKKFSRLKVMNSSSEEESSGEKEDEESSVQLDIPPTDDEEDEVPVKASRRSIAARLIKSEDESSDDDEDKLRKSLYLAEEDVEDDPSVEEQAYSKSTRQSILPHYEPDSEVDEDDDGSVLIAESDEEEENQKNPMGSPALSSTIRSPLKERTNNTQSISIDDSVEEIPSIEKKTVSKSYYDQVKAQKELLEHQKNTLESRRDLMKNLPDGGQKVLKKIEGLTHEIKVKQEEIDSMVVDENLSVKNEIARSFNNTNDSSISFHEVIPPQPQPKSMNDLVKMNDVKPIFFGKAGMETYNNMVQGVQSLCKDLLEQVKTRPADIEEIEPPKHLKIELMKHQKQALKFMMWRESLKPRGGILADDMGLGKTLTVISLILKKIQIEEESEEESDDDDEENGQWKSKGRKDLKDGANLIICPASLVKQWEHEIKTKVKRGALDVYVFHGPNRAHRARDLVKYDVVLTSYQLAASEFKNQGVLYNVNWKRIVLDEGHVIRNHKSKQAEAMFELHGKYRWVLTGTPIQNKEFDLFATIKFLRVSAIDVTVWNRSIAPKDPEGKNRVMLLLSALMLRRTKEQLIKIGDIDSLPSKIVQQFEVDLNKEEKFIYMKVTMYSQAVFANYLSQQMERNNNYDYDRKKFGRVYKQMAQKFQITHDIKAHEILVLLMRLRQACCHPGLMKEMLAMGELNVDGGEGEAEHNESDVDLLKQIENLKIDDDVEDEAGQRWSIDNPVFQMDMPSTKMLKLMEVLREFIIPTNDKAIIVSQWTGYLNVIRGMLEVEGITYCELNGTVKVKDRNDIVQNFNNENSGVKVMLLSLTAGGVGLNLVGANYLILMDLHWNPQLEQQAQDRIYRFGQKKDVKIFKFVCTGTIEERILKMQKVKMDIATSSLTGVKIGGSKLTFNEMKDLFGMADTL